MKTAATHRAILIVGFILLAFNILFLDCERAVHARCSKGVVRLRSRCERHRFFNQHFIRDIGMIQIFLGAAFGIGIIRPAVRFELWAAATVWLIAMPSSTCGKSPSAYAGHRSLSVTFPL